MRIALTHIVSPRIAKCELTHRPRAAIDLNLAGRQHAAYCRKLRAHGLKVVELTVNSVHPDSA